MEAINKHVDECYDNLTATERATMKKMVKDSVESGKRDAVYAPPVKMRTEPTKALLDQVRRHHAEYMAAKGNPPKDDELPGLETDYNAGEEDDFEEFAGESKMEEVD